MALRIVLVLCVLFVLHLALRGFRKLSPPQRRRCGGWLLVLFSTTLLAFLFLRFGFHWLLVAGAAGLAAVRRGLPWLLRLLPFVRRWWSHRSSGRADGAHDDNQRAGPRPGDARRPPGQSGGRGSSAPGRRPRGKMTQREALDVLGLDESASEQDILRAYRELMKRVHPDKPGGSTYLAARLNEARETLLG